MHSTMVRSFLSCFLLLFCVGMSLAATAIEPQPPPPPGIAPFCTDKVEGKKKVGEEWHDMKLCVKKICGADSEGTPLISHYSCGTVHFITPANQTCRLVKPTEPKPYPYCCPVPVCDHDNEMK